jgi:hypothetical protein
MEALKKKKEASKEKEENKEKEPSPKQSAQCPCRRAYSGNEFSPNFARHKPNRAV